MTHTHVKYMERKTSLAECERSFVAIIVAKKAKQKPKKKSAECADIHTHNNNNARDKNVR